MATKQTKIKSKDEKKVEKPKTEVKKEVKVEKKVREIPKELLERLFNKPTDSPKGYAFHENELLEKSKEEIIKDFWEFHDSERLSKMPEGDNKLRTVYSFLYRKYKGIIDTNKRSEKLTICIIPEFSDSDAKDIYTKKRERGQTTDSLYLRNFAGLQFDEKEGAYIPLVMDSWGEVATKQYPMDEWIKVRASPKTPFDSDEYRVLTLKKYIGKDKVIVGGEVYNVPTLEEIEKNEYVPVIEVDEVPKYADIKVFDEVKQKLITEQIGKFVIVKGGISNVSPEPSAKGNYSYELTGNNDEIPMDKKVTLRVNTKEAPTLDVGSDLRVMGRPFKGTDNQGSEEDIGSEEVVSTNYVISAVRIEGGEIQLPLEESSTLGVSGEYEEFVPEKVEEKKEEKVIDFDELTEKEKVERVKKHEEEKEEIPEPDGIFAEEPEFG